MLLLSGKQSIYIDGVRWHLILIQYMLSYAVFPCLFVVLFMYIQLREFRDKGVDSANNPDLSGLGKQECISIVRFFSFLVVLQS